jgi:hypothetical protein
MLVTLMLAALLNMWTVLIITPVLKMNVIQILDVLIPKLNVMITMLVLMIIVIRDLVVLSR